MYGTYLELTAVLNSLNVIPANICSENIAVIERFEVLLDNRTSNIVKVNVEDMSFCREIKNIREYPTNPSCPSTACQKSRVPRWLCVGPSIVKEPYSAKTEYLGMEE